MLNKGEYILMNEDNNEILNREEVHSHCKHKTLALMSSNGREVKQLNNCKHSSATWEEMALVGQTAMGQMNKFKDNCSKQHLSEKEIGLEFAKTGQKVVAKP